MFDSSLKVSEDFELYLRIKSFARIRFLPSVKVYISHRNSFKAIIKMNFDRAYWIFKIYKKHRKDKEIYDVPEFRSIQIKNNLLFPFWMCLQFFKKPVEESYFILVSEIAWRLGLLWGMMENEKLKFYQHRE